MNKYEAAKTLKLTTARLARTCDSCGGSIGRGMEYYRESLGQMAKPPSVVLRSYCVACGKTSRSLLHNDAGRL